MDTDYYAEESRLLTQTPEPKEKKTMQIQIIATSVETKPTAKGSYQMLEVTFKNLTYNKTESKKVMSFGANAPAFKVLSESKANEVYEITVVKNSAGYNDWTSAVPSAPGAAAAPAAGAGKPMTTKSTYETTEERAQRQILIVRQSSVDRALAYHSIGAKTPPKLSEVFDTAQQIADFVFQIKDTGPSGFEDLPDFDVPEVE